MYPPVLLLSHSNIISWETFFVVRVLDAFIFRRKLRTGWRPDLKREESSGDAGDNIRYALHVIHPAMRILEKKLTRAICSR